MIFKINVRWRDKIGDFWWGILCLLYLQIMIGMLPFKVFAEMALPEMDLLEMDIAEPQIPNSIIPPLSHAQLASEPVLPVTNGAIVIHTQRLKSDPGGNLLS